MFLKTYLLTDSKAADQALRIERFEDHVRNQMFPCVGAKAALSRQQIQYLVVGDIRCPRDDQTIHAALCDFAKSYSDNPGPFQSFVVIFDTDQILDEEAFEAALWARVQALENLDAAKGYTYDPRVSADENSPHFSLSFGGEAFFIVGLHPGASRPARRFDSPVLVFNAHDQFEALRSDGRYEPLRDNIIKRDIALAGTPNPMLSRHGERSEANQYSGRSVGMDWKCPYKRVHE